MATLAVKIPPMGESITGGVLVQWRVQDGDLVRKDQALYELETDKITAEGTAEAAGRIALKVGAGSDVTIGQVVATIETGEGGEPSTEPAGAASSAASPAPASPAVNPPPKTQNSKPDLPASPAVRRLSSERGVDPNAVAGTGKGGRVTKGDLLAAAQSGPKPEVRGQPSAAPNPELQTPNSKVGAISPPVPPVGASGSLAVAPAPSAEAPRQTRRKLSPLRQRIAQRLVQAQHEAAMLTTFNEVDLTAVRDLRALYQESFTQKHGVKLGFMSFFVKAVVRALQDVPALNARIDGDTVVENHYFDIGVAVSTERGLLVPVVRDCDRAGFADIERQIAAAAQKARDSKIALADLEGGVFTITNGGVFGSLLSTPILNAPQCGILGLHAIQDRPVAVNGQVVIRPMMYVALSYDHRLVDGREAVTFLVRVKQAIEDPSRLLLSV